MRLIDADALDYNRLPAYYGDSVREDDVKDWIADAPTIDAAPVVHGHWIEHHDDLCSLFNGWECSECKQIVSGGRGNYCPNCGAKMDSKEDES